MIPLVSIMLGTKFSNFNELVCHACFPLLFFQNNMETGCANICHKICTDLLFSVCDSKRKDFFFQACHLCKWYRQRRFEIWPAWTQSFKVSLNFPFHLQKWSSLSAVGKLLLLQIFNRTWKQWVFSQPRRNCILVNICTTLSIRNLFRFALINYLNYLSSQFFFWRKFVLFNSIIPWLFCVFLVFVNAASFCFFHNIWTLLRPIPVRALMPIYASSDESTEDGSFMSSDQQRHSDSSSVQTASSCPSGYLNDVDQQYRHPLLSLNTDNEQASHAPRRQFLGFDDSSLKDSTLNPGYNVYSPLSPTASEECTESNYHHLTLCSQHFHMLSVVLKIHSFAKMLLRRIHTGLPTAYIWSAGRWWSWTKPLQNRTEGKEWRYASME